MEGHHMYLLCVGSFCDGERGKDEGRRSCEGGAGGVERNGRAEGGESAVVAKQGGKLRYVPISAHRVKDVHVRKVDVAWFCQRPSRDKYSIPSVTCPV